MNHASIHEKLPIARQEIRRGQPFPGVLHLRVTESQPDGLHLVLGKEPFDDLDIRPQERHILQPLVQGLSRSRPHTGALDIHPDEIHLGIELR